MASPSFHTKRLYFGECEGCGRMFQAGNAMGLAAQHYDRCGSRITLEVTTHFVWEPGYEARKAREQAEQEQNRS